MQNVLDRKSICSCCARELPAHASELGVGPSRGIAPAPESESNPFLRPGVDCLERWLDLNA
jgi:hypothetical protein